MEILIWLLIIFGFLIFIGLIISVIFFIISSKHHNSPPIPSPNLPNLPNSNHSNPSNPSSSSIPNRPTPPLPVNGKESISVLNSPATLQSNQILVSSNGNCQLGYINNRPAIISSELPPKYLGEAAPLQFTSGGNIQIGNSIFGPNGLGIAPFKLEMTGYNG